MVVLANPDVKVVTASSVLLDGARLEFVPGIHEVARVDIDGTRTALGNLDSEGTFDLPDVVLQPQQTVVLEIAAL